MASSVPGSLLGEKPVSRFRLGFREWYQDNRRRQVRSWGLLGVGFGLVTGYIMRKWKIAHHVYGDHILVTEYYVDRNNEKVFEAFWNEHAKRTQRFVGYQGTKLFKVLNRDWVYEASPSEEGSQKDTRTMDLREEKGAGTTTSFSNSPLSAKEAHVKEGGVEKRQSYTVQQAAADDAGGVTEAPPRLLKEQRFPFQYLQLRSWNSVGAEKGWKNDEDVQRIVQKMENTCKRVQTYEYGTLADDSIKRLIW